MKTAISLPDDLSTIIEKFIEKAHLSRSEFFQLAAREYLNKHAAQSITAALDKVHDADTDPDDNTFLKTALHHWAEQSKDETW